MAHRVGAFLLVSYDASTRRCGIFDDVEIGIPVRRRGVAAAFFTALRNTTRPPTPSTQPTRRRCSSACARRPPTPSARRRTSAGHSRTTYSLEGVGRRPHGYAFEGGVFELELNIGVRYRSRRLS